MAGADLPVPNVLLADDAFGRSWCFQRYDGAGLYSLIVSFSWLFEVSLLEHFGRLRDGLDYGGNYPRISGLRKTVENLYFTLRRLHAAALHIQKWRR